ncbi:MAG: hypothetical protein HY318_15020, partial [Armatimonadetes bacterium]|nr:hypothetical protein [Armatimonadota bacterium]
RDIEFSWLLVPNDPTQPAPAPASKIEFLKDEPQLVAVRLEIERGRAEWMVLNEEGKRIDLSYKGNGKALTTDARRLYLDCRNGKPVRSWVSEATVLKVGGTEVFRKSARKNVTVGKV